MPGDGPVDPGATPIPGDFGAGLDGDEDFSTSVEIDECEQVADASGDRIDLVFPSNLFDAGRRVLLVQMRDSVGDSGETATVNDPLRAGQWEEALLADVSGSTLTLTAPLRSPQPYESSLSGPRAQVCLVREYASVTIRNGATVSPRKWDGEHGGIIAWRVSNVLTLEPGAALSADATGFRGGMCGSLGDVEGVSGFDVPMGWGGGKGEGIDGRFFTLFGRGAVANAGGGGNGNNAGGGGGANGGRGGDGGREQFSGLVLGTDDTRGLAGGEIAANGRLYFGGGGGAGHLQHSQLGRCGGAGGGILAISAKALAGAGRLSANGENGEQVEQDGGSGGGAGGTLLLETSDATAFLGAIEADGGEGGDVRNFSFSTNYGPGGGGGGGRITLTGFPPVTLVHAFGNVQGLNESNGNPHLAQDGEDGIVVMQ